MFLSFMGQIYAMEYYICQKLFENGIWWFCSFGLFNSTGKSPFVFTHLLFSHTPAYTHPADFNFVTHCHQIKIFDWFRATTTAFHPRTYRASSRNGCSSPSSLYVPLTPVHWQSPLTYLPVFVHPVFVHFVFPTTLSLGTMFAINRYDGYYSGRSEQRREMEANQTKRDLKDSDSKAWQEELDLESSNDMARWKELDAKRSDLVRKFIDLRWGSRLQLIWIDPKTFPAYESRRHRRNLPKQRKTLSLVPI